MEDSYLYQQIAEWIRQEILEGRRKPGEKLPSVRQMCRQWNCTPGTVQRAYNQLAREGLLVSQAGRGTQVAGGIPPERSQVEGALRRASLVHRSEAFLLEALTAGHSLEEIQQALEVAMDRWRALQTQPAPPASDAIRFMGSHDMLLSALMRTFFSRQRPAVNFQIQFNGSLGGLMALTEGGADLVGSHLWDAETDTYNEPFVRRLLPGKCMLLVTLALRRQGLILGPGNPLGIRSLADVAAHPKGARFVNRQPGSGTRVWLDATLARQGISPRAIRGYNDERTTHSDLARMIAEGQADVGLGLETAARAFGLDFIFMTRERYDLVLLADTLEQPPLGDSLKALIDWLASAEAKAFVENYPGYESELTGQVMRLENG